MKMNGRVVSSQVWVFASDLEPKVQHLCEVAGDAGKEREESISTFEYVRYAHRTAPRPLNFVELVR